MFVWPRFCLLIQPSVQWVRWLLGLKRSGRGSDRPVCSGAEDANGLVLYLASLLCMLMHVME